MWKIYIQSYPVRYSQKLCFVLNAAHSNDTQCSGPGSGIDSADKLIIVIFYWHSFSDLFTVRTSSGSLFVL